VAPAATGLAALEQRLQELEARIAALEASAPPAT
jgi:BMFP domain-containing protein YqiC